MIVEIERVLPLMAAILIFRCTERAGVPQIVGIVGTVLDETVEKSAYLGEGGIFSKLRSRPILPSPPPPGSSIVGSSKESRIPKYLWEATLNWGRGFFYAKPLIWK